MSMKTLFWLCPKLLSADSVYCFRTANTWLQKCNNRLIPIQLQLVEAKANLLLSFYLFKEILFCAYFSLGNLGIKILLVNLIHMEYGFVLLIKGPKKKHRMYEKED